MRLLLKEYDYTDGEIFFHDVALSEIKQRHVHLHRRKIGMVFQDYKLIPEMNIWENIALPLSVTGKPMEEIERRVTDLLNLIKLPEKALQFPSQLSGGEAQRVGIARALAVGPEVVIADEPTGNLDPETAQSIARLLKKINELGTTVVIATHDRTILSSYPETRTLTLVKGSLITDAAPTKTKEGTSTVNKNSDEKSTKSQPVEKKPNEPTVVTEELDTSEEKAAVKTSWWSKLFGKKTKPAATASSEEKQKEASEPPQPEISEIVEELDEPPAKPVEKKKSKEVKEKIAHKKAEK
jgi:cell division transport system ATP-binding protein